jgi:hypothetical protein
MSTTAALQTSKRNRATKAAKAAIDDVNSNPNRGALLPYLMQTYAPESGSNSELSTIDWEFVLRQFWTSCEFFYDWVEKLTVTFPQYGPMRNMMTFREWTAYQALPEIVTIYRGQPAGMQTGLSWTLSIEVANWFATRFDDEGSVIMTAKIPKSYVLAVKLERREMEVVTYDVDIVKTEPANASRAEVYFELCQRRERRALAARGAKK